MPKSGKDQPKRGAAASKQDEAVPEAAVSLLHSIANLSVKGGKSRVGESSPNLGMTRLFPNKTDTDSAERAYKKTLELLKAEGIEKAQLDWLGPKLVAVAQRFWVEHERDTRATSSDMKDEVTLLQRDLAKTITRLGELTLATRQALNAGVRSLIWPRNGPGPNHVIDLHEKSVLLHHACEQISLKKNPTRVRRSYRFEHCCADLWAIRETITGNELSQTFDLKGNSFITVDATFIYEVMKALDGPTDEKKVTASKVQDGLRRAAQAKNKRK